MPGPTYAVVQDIPASWSTYLEAAEPLHDPKPEGLLVHLAGPTEEGVRVIDVWESQAAWEQCRDERPLATLDEAVPAWRTHTTFRDLTVQHLFMA